MHCVLSGKVCVEVIVELSSEVLDILDSTEYHPFLYNNLLKGNPNTIDASKFLAWLFEIYTICNDKEACYYVKTKAFQILHFIPSSVSDEILRAQDIFFKQKE